MNYINKETGAYYHGGSITIKTNKGLFSGVPTEEELIAWGFESVDDNEPNEPTEEEIIKFDKQRRMNEILDELNSTDYLALKAFEGEDMSEHEGWKEHRAALREEYRQLKNEYDETFNEIKEEIVQELQEEQLEEQIEEQEEKLVNKNTKLNINL